MGLGCVAASGLSGAPYCSVLLPLRDLRSKVPTRPKDSAAPQAPAARDGQHDFDFEIGTWKTHLSRLVHPLTGSNTWVTLEGITVVRKIWDGKANLAELDIETPKGHVQVLSLRLYSPEAHQWSLNTANSSLGNFERPDHRRIRKWPRRVLRSGAVQWQKHSGAQCLVGHHRRFVPLRTIILRRRWQDVGTKLDRSGHAGER